MADKLNKLMEQNPDKQILAIVGAGHEEDIRKILKNPRISYSISFG